MYFDRFWYPNTITAPYDCYACDPLFLLGILVLHLANKILEGGAWIGCYMIRACIFFQPLSIHGEQQKLQKLLKFRAEKKQLLDS